MEQKALISDAIFIRVNSYLLCFRTKLHSRARTSCWSYLKQQHRKDGVVNYEVEIIRTERLGIVGGPLQREATINKYTVCVNTVSYNDRPSYRTWTRYYYSSVGAVSGWRVRKQNSIKQNTNLEFFFWGGAGSIDIFCTNKRFFCSIIVVHNNTVSILRTKYII